MDKKNDNEALPVALLGFPILFLIALIVYIPLALFNAWIALTLYDWFARPLGAPELNIWHAWGLMLLISRFNQHTSADSDKAWIKIAASIIAGLLALLIGFVLQAWI